MRRARESILGRYADGWQRKIEEERRKIIAENVPDGVAAEAVLSPIEYATRFEMCVVAQVAARYQWRIRTNDNGAVKVVSVAKSRRFNCGMIGGVWFCR
jgi:predicted GNAT family acetyltransferase